MAPTLRLPTADGRVEPFTVPDQVPFGAVDPARFNRVAYAAAHVVADPLAMRDPWITPAIDWDATMAFRRHLWSLGFRVAEAMDTAQRGMGLGWDEARELIGRSLAEARTVPGADLASGVGTEQLAPADARSVDDVIRAYETQFEAVEGFGGRAILMASRALVRVAGGPDDYRRVYRRLIDGSAEPVILHWLGDMFDPELAGYWGTPDFAAALDLVASIIAENPSKVEGIKISLLDAGKEVALRDRLPEGVIMYSGDDFNYPELIEGDGRRHSHALLGIFDAIAPAAAAALDRLGAGDVAAFRAILGPTVPLSRRMFETPTRFYKAGVVFLAWLNGHQDHFTMVGGLQSARSIVHYADLFRLAAAANLLGDAERAAARMRTLAALHGIA
jgi:hypothetical protein